MTICTGRSAMARLSMLSAIDMPQPPQLVLPARRERLAAIRRVVGGRREDRLGPPQSRGRLHEDRLAGRSSSTPHPR